MEADLGFHRETLFRKTKPNLLFACPRPILMYQWSTTAAVTILFKMKIKWWWWLLFLIFLMEGGQLGFEFRAYMCWESILAFSYKNETLWKKFQQIGMNYDCGVAVSEPQRWSAQSVWFHLCSTHFTFLPNSLHTALLWIKF